jgi:dTDP-4-dehydrorhamnose reductase
MSTKILVLGGAGMLGHKMFQHLRAEFSDVVCAMRRSASIPPLDHVELLQGPDVLAGVDVMDFDGLSSWLHRLRPDFTINCVGIIKQRRLANDAVSSITINSLFPHQLAALAARWGGRVIHFSTDCVFNGHRGRYTESDPPDALDLYGRSKSLGEVVAANALTLRTSIIGRELLEHRSLLDWFLSQNGHRVRGYRKALYSGVTTNYLAATVAAIIHRKPALSGLYQIASERLSKLELLHLLRNAYCLNIEIEPDDTYIYDRSMLGARFVEATGIVCPPWTELIDQLATDPTPYNRWVVS